MADGQHYLGGGHKGLGSQRRPRRAHRPKSRYEDQVDRKIDYKRNGSENIELAQASVGCEEGAEDICHADGDDAEDDHTENRHIFCATFMIQQSHQRLGEDAAKHRDRDREKQHGPEDNAYSSRERSAGSWLRRLFHIAADLGEYRQQGDADEVGHHGDGIEKAESACIDAGLCIADHIA